MRDRYAPVLDWIDGGQLTWRQWQVRHGGGPLSWVRFAFSTHDQGEIMSALHGEMLAAEQPHTYRGIFYGGRE